MYIPKSKYRPAKYTDGNRFTKSDGTFYTGWYIETFRGDFLSGKTPTASSEMLTDNQVSEQEFAQYKFTNDIITPTEKDYKEGYFYRYFVQDKRNNAIIEVVRDKYKYYVKQRYTREIKVKWILEGPAENINRGLYIYFGAASKNEEAIKEAENTIIGLSSVINLYNQFVK